MEFCITYIIPAYGQDIGLHLRRQHVRHGGGNVLLFSTQRRAMKWIVKHGNDDYSYAVDPYHDLEGTHAPAK